MMDINELTLGQIKEIQKLTGAGGKSELPFEVGKSYLFRSVTHIDVGRVRKIVGKFIELENASWIAETGRYHNCLRDGVFNEVEPYPEYAGFNTDSLIDYAPWSHELPKEQK